MTNELIITRMQNHHDLHRIISLMDLTTLSSTDTRSVVEVLCKKAVSPLPASPSLHCVAVCVWSNFAEIASTALQGSSVALACVAAAFPHCQAPLQVKIDEIRYAVDHGATEIDVTINRGDFLTGQHNKVFDELHALKLACGHAHLKVILEVCELPDVEAVGCASDIALRAGADFIKTSTGKGSSGASLDTTAIMLETVVNFTQSTGKTVGVKVAGGIRTTDQALAYLQLADRFLGIAIPQNFRIGASSLLDDILISL